MRILILESDLNLREVLLMACIKFNHDAQAVDSCAEAFGEINDKNFDVIITDILFDGEYTVGIVHYFYWRNPGKAVIILTSTALLARKNFLKGTKHVLLKPVTLEDLENTLDKIEENL